MQKIFKFKTKISMTLLTAAFISTGCGGGSSEYDAPPIHGAIAAQVTGNITTGAASLLAKLYSQKAANEQALSICKSDCSIVLEFAGTGICGAFATEKTNYGASPWGVGSGNGLQLAQGLAVDQCKSRGGKQCLVKLSACN